MDIQTTTRKHLQWIASVTFVALLAGPSSVGAQPCVITFPGAPPPDGTVGMAYEQGISGSSPYLLILYSVTAGTLPPGLNLTPIGNETWVIVGTPTATGRFTFTITATNGPNGSLCSGEVTYTINIAAAVPTLPEWAMIVLIGLLAWAGFAALRRRPRRATRESRMRGCRDSGRRRLPKPRVIVKRWMDSAPHP